MHYPEKKGYSARSLTYMCQFARTYPLEILQRMLSCDKVLRTPTIPNMLSLTDELNCLPITQEPLAQFQTNIFQSKEFTQEPLAQIQKNLLKRDRNVILMILKRILFVPPFQK